MPQQGSPMSLIDRVKEWDQYFSIHCELPAAAIRDLFDEIERLREHYDKHLDDRIQWQKEIERLRVALERISAFCDIEDGYEIVGNIAREALKGG